MPDTEIVQLFKEIQRGDKAAFDELFKHYYHKLVAFARQYTKQQESAEEITSELFVKLWLKRNALSKVLNPEVYLYISVKNACLNLIRSDKRRTTLFVQNEEDEGFEVLSNGHTTLLEDKELRKLLDSAVASLPEQRKMVFKLIKEDGLKTAAVAQILGISKRTVENQLYKAIKTLAEALSVYLGYHPQSKAAKKQQLRDLSLLFF
ncbi:RNA polymerase sigma-70 factor [Pedobacter sp.]|uniref:RNA polymerase sigma-70 factor n=1 Tax=Pedobacter sp. TaxID=1411316 RepID=UPI0031E22716